MPGYMLDMKPTGFGLVALGYHAKAAYADPLTDQLYLVLSEIDEPAEPYLPIPSSAPTVSTTEIYEFDSPNAYGDMTYRYRGRLNLLPRPGAFTYCKVKADDYLNLLLNVYGDGVLIFSVQVTSKEEFTLPMLDEYESCEIELVGTSRVRSYQLVESIEEIT